MGEQTKARFWKCALQVNSASYIKYRGSDHGFSEEEYNRELARVAVKNGIKVIGLADHGNVDSVDAIRAVMKSHGIIVFPGFEIASSEKVHFVCLYPEDTSKANLYLHLGNLEFHSRNGIDPSNLSAVEIIRKVENEQGGFIYAAHCTQDNGLLKKRLNNIWKNNLLSAAQIPGSIEDLKGVEGDFFRKAILNKVPEYKRESRIAVINAGDVAEPKDLAKPGSSCLIRMTRPDFDAFKLAFKDPESRIRLNTDIPEEYYSRIERVRVTGGYLDGLCIDLSENLNAVIGGRGTGKSTLLEFIRFALGYKPIGSSARKQHDDIIKENLSKVKGRIELTIRSHKMNNRRFSIARRYGDPISAVTDEDGASSTFEPRDLLPDTEIFGQGEIHEIARDKDQQLLLLGRFLGMGSSEADSGLGEILEKLTENRKKITEAHQDIDNLEDELSRLPKIEEQIEQFRKLGIEDRLNIIPLLEKVKTLLQRAYEQEGPNLNAAFDAVKDSLPDTTFLNDTVLESLPPFKDLFVKIRRNLDDLRKEAEGLLVDWHRKYGSRYGILTSLADRIKSGIQSEGESLEKLFKELPSCEGKSGTEVGVEFQRLQKERERIRPMELTKAAQENLLNELMNRRKALLNELSEKRAERLAVVQKSVNRLNRRLKNKLRLNVEAGRDRKPMRDFFLDCNLDGVAKGRLAWIEEAKELSPVSLANTIRSGGDALKDSGWNIPPTAIAALKELSKEQTLRLEEIELPDKVDIELNVSHGDSEEFRVLERLSTGQQCTALLHLLLLDNKDPLIVDQPEDNLDNTFIADRIVAELRRSKVERQYLFATHNANIPVFGDAEWIGVLETEDQDGRLVGVIKEESQGAIDAHKVRDMAAKILEGGEEAFNQRRHKYNL